MQIRTNKMDYLLNYEAIQNDFEITCLRFTDRTELLKAYSMSFPTYGILTSYAEQGEKQQFLYLMGRKRTVDFRRFTGDLASIKVNTVTMRDIGISRGSRGLDYILIRLLLQLLAAGRDSTVSIPYGNYYGHLFSEKKPLTKLDTGHGIKVNGETLMFDRIHYTKENTVCIEVETWKPFVKNLNRKKNTVYKQKSVLQLEEFNRYMIKVPWNEVEDRLEIWEKSTANRDAVEKKLFSRWYVRGTHLPMRKNAMPFLTISSHKGRILDKTVIYMRFLQAVREKLSDYLKLIPKLAEMEKVLTEDEASAEKERNAIVAEAVEIINQKGLHIVCRDIAQRKYADKVLAVLSRNSLLPVLPNKLDIGDTLSPNTWNLQIVYARDSKEYADAEGKYDAGKDEYALFSGCVTQHMVCDTKDDDKKVKNKIFVILLELLIKDGLLKGRLSVSLSPHKKITVIKGRKVYDEDGKYKEMEFFVMTIAPNGQILFKKHFTETDNDNSSLENEIIDKFDDIDIENEGYRTLFTTEGLFKIDDSELCAIYKTTERPFPNFEKLMDDFAAQSSDAKKIDIEEAKKYMEEYAVIKPKFKEIACYVEDEWELLGNPKEVSIRSWRTLLRMAAETVSGRPVASFSNYLKKKTDGRLYLIMNIKTEKNNPYELDALTKIAYREEEKTYAYFVGLRALHGLNTSETIRNSFPLRVVERDDSFTFEDYVDMLNVSWVRAGTKEMTVIPFPFKVLNEYIRLEDNKSK